MKPVSYKRIFPVLLALAVLIGCLQIGVYAVEPAAAAVLQAGQWECNSSVMTGAYLDLSAWPSDLGEVDLYFTSGGLGFMSMSYGYDLQTSKGNCLYFGDTLVYSFGITDPGWASDAYAQIYFDADQAVSQAFYDWFTSNFTYVGRDYEEPVFNTVINIWNTTGTELLASYSETGNIVAPAVTGSFMNSGLTIVDADNKVWSWTYTGDPFYGFALHPNFTTVAYDAGETFFAGGLAADYVLDLYLVTSLPPADSEYQSGVLGWFQRLFDMITELPKRIWDHILGEDVLAVVNEASATLDPIGIFRLAFNFLSAGHGLESLLEDPDGPFAWLRG